MKFFQRNVVSTSVNSYSFDDESLELVVDFKSDVSYRYFDVDVATFNEMQIAESVGNFVATRIKKFKYEKIEGASLNVPKPWKFPKAEDFKKDLSDASRWPFPTSKKP